VERKVQPKIALLMLTYNHSDCLSKSINDILSQTYKNFTLQIVDDFSEDHSFEIAKAFEILDSRVRVIKNTRNLGMFENFEMNLKGLFNESKFDFFGWLGPDDEWSDTWLENLIQMEAPKDMTGVRQSFVIYDYQSGREIREYSDLPSTNLTFKDSKVLRKGYGELIHGLWDRRTVELIIQDSQLVPFRYLLKLENLFISLLIEKRGFTMVRKPLHTKHKASGSKNRYKQNYFFRNPNRIILVAIRALPGIIRLIKGKQKNHFFILGSFLIDLRVALPKKVKI
jgi:GT2 family glycosyltransferase